MNLRIGQPHQNGTHGAPPQPGGASTLRSATPQPARPVTIFPDEAPRTSWRVLAYELDRFLLGGTPVRKMVNGLLWLVALLWATGWFPGGRAVSLVAVLLVIANWLLWARLRRQDFVSFTEKAPPEVTPEMMPVADKIAIHATGQFSVEGKYRRFTWLPGFYRTFATGEHAVLCLVRGRRFLRVARWPQDEVGMWYVFFMPRDILRIRWGRLRFGRQDSLALAIDYNMTIPSEDPHKPDRSRPETLYLAVESEADGRRILADLHFDVTAGT
ncbi:MAG: hypothetical protein KatS3mg050_2749 [Litorilinea sp.]|nr:MAG: hypothetical protein KatS3mg050_2749 [Litorilinea sp.]